MTSLPDSLVSCGECGSPNVERHCDFCNTSLCVSCVGKHLSDSTKTHNAVPFLLYKYDKLDYTFVRCPSHISFTFKYKCERFCKKCNVPVCSKSESRSIHEGHELFLLRRVPPELNEWNVDASYTNVLTNEHELHDKPQIIATIDTGFHRLFGVASFKNEGIWTCGNDENVVLFNLKGKKLQNVKTTSMRRPRDIAVTTSGDLVYTDPNARTVNMVKDGQIQELIVIEGWKPYHICCTPSDDFLVTMIRSDEKQSKVVRYNGKEGTEKQTYQFDDKGKPLYSSDRRGKYICENNNLDVCVSDAGSRAIVVVNKAGKFRFRYTGLLNNPFQPHGIATDSQSRILSVDYSSGFIHIVDVDGRFLRHITNCDLYEPYGLCINSFDELFVAEQKGNVKRIKYTE